MGATAPTSGTSGAKVGSRRRPGRPADTDSAATRSRIVECARERFAAEGFEGTTNKQIADRAGVSSTALYHYFPSKADLYVAVCGSIDESFDEAIGRARRRHSSLEGRLVALFEEAARIATESPSTMSFISGISAVVQRHPEVAVGAQRLRTDFRKLVFDLVDTAEDKDTVLRGATTRAFADLVTSVLAGLGRLNARGEKDRHIAAGDAFLRLIRGV